MHDNNQVVSDLRSFSKGKVVRTVEIAENGFDVIFEDNTIIGFHSPIGILEVSLGELKSPEQLREVMEKIENDLANKSEQIARKVAKQAEEELDRILGVNRTEDKNPKPFVTPKFTIHVKRPNGPVTYNRISLEAAMKAVWTDIQENQCEPVCITNQEGECWSYRDMQEYFQANNFGK